jgi:hypothetical protein
VKQFGQGLNGIKGLKGIKGFRGLKGDKGLNGQQGLKGSKGSDGQNGSKVRISNNKTIYGTTECIFEGFALLSTVYI